MPNMDTQGLGRSMRAFVAATLVVAAIEATAVRSAFAAEPKDAASACALATPTLSRLGFAALPLPLSQQERRTLKEANLAFRQANLAKSKAVLEGLAAKHPDDGGVRYRLAAANAASGDFRSACSEMARVLELDFVGFAERYESDKAFAPLQSSEAGVQLREHARAVEKLWRQAIQTGLPVMMSRGTRGPMEIWRPSYLRGGVYVHEVQRFLPMEPGVDGASAALVNPKANSVAVVKPTVSACHDHFCPRFLKAQVTIFSLVDFRRSPVRWHMEEQGAETTMIDLRSGPQGVAIRIHDCCCWKGCTSPWTPVGLKAGGPTPGTSDSARQPSTLDMSVDMLVDFRGSLLGAVPEGTRLGKGRMVVDGEAEIPLAAEHEPTAIHDVLVDARTGARLVFSAVDRCECSAKKVGPILRYAISTVDGRTGKATAVEHGEGTGAAMLDGKQAVYVQTGTTLRRWPSISAVGAEVGLPIMPGVVLVVPRSPSGNCCGL